MDKETEKIEEKRTTPSKEKKEAAPHTRVKSAGKVNRRLEILAEMYIKTHEGKDVRWVYSPIHKPELSNVVYRQADKYELVFVRDLGKDVAVYLPGMENDDLIRVGDVVMMSIDAEIRRGYQEDLDKAAEGEYARVEEEFYGTVDEIQLAKGMRQEYKVRPMGRSVTEAVEQEVDGPESHREA